MPRHRPKILVTGGAGFIGSEFVRQGVRQGHRIAVVDKLTYAGDPARLRAVRDRISFHRADICRPGKMEDIFRAEKPDIVVHFATETHVDRSLIDAKPFITTNVLGTQVLVETALARGIKKFIHISTDEVYGETRAGRFSERASLNPGNPYAASKAAADMLVKAAVRSRGFPAIIIRPSNNYGPWQYPEKFIPVAIFKALNNQRVPVYGKGQQRREWLFVADCADAVWTVLHKGRIRETYNVSSHHEQSNLRTCRDVLRALGKKQELIRFVKDRPGHDFRYSIDCGKVKKIGWAPQTSWGAGLRETVAWFRDHEKWVSAKARRLEGYWKKVYQPSTD